MRNVRRLRDEPLSAELCDEVIRTTVELLLRVAGARAPFGQASPQMLGLVAEVARLVESDIGSRLTSDNERNTLRWCLRGMEGFAEAYAAEANNFATSEMPSASSELAIAMRSIDWFVLVLVVATLANDDCEPERLAQLLDEAFLRLCDRAPMWMAVGVDLLGASRSVVERAHDFDSAVNGLRAGWTDDATSALHAARLATLR